MSKSLNLKKVTVVLVIFGLVIVCAGIGINLYANSRSNDAKSQLNSMAEGSADKYPYWDFGSRYEYARTQNPALANQLQEADNMMSLGVTIIEVGGVIVAVVIILFVVQRLLIKTIDNRIKEADKK